MKTKLFFILLIASILLISCKSDSGNLDTITIATFSKALGNAPYLVAKHFKWFEEEPLLKGTKIIYTEFNDRPTISTAFDKGQLQVLFSAETPQYLCRAQGNDIRVVAVSASAAQEILVPIASKIKKVNELKGKSIAVLAGTSSHYCLLKILKTYGLSVSDVQIKYMGAAEAEVAFQTGQLDAWAVWAPWVEKQQANGTGRVLEGGDAVIVSTMAMPSDFINKHKSIAASIVKIIQRAKEWILNNPGEAQKIAATELSLNADVVKIAWPKFKWNEILNDRILDDFQEKANFLTYQEKTRLEKPLDVRKEFVYMDFIENK